MIWKGKTRVLPKTAYKKLSSSEDVRGIMAIEVSHRLRLLFPFPSRQIRAVKAELQSYLSELLEPFQITCQIIKAHSNQWWDIIIHGSEESIPLGINLLKSEVGLLTSVSDIQEGEIRLGRLVTPTQFGFGWFVDVGVRPRKDVLLPLHELRKSLNGCSDMSLREITEQLGFINGLPLVVEITGKRFFSEDNLEIEARLEDRWTSKINSWISGENEWLIVLGTFRNRILHALRSSQHFRDLVAMETFDPLSHVLFFQPSTRSSGLIPRLGPHLKGARLGSGRPITAENI